MAFYNQKEGQETKETDNKMRSMGNLNIGAIKHEP